MRQSIVGLLEYPRGSFNAKVPIQVENALVVENAVAALNSSLRPDNR
jgi:hypothetical protein